MDKSVKEYAAPVLFLAVGAFWLAIVATGGGLLLGFAALASILSGLLILAMPSHWVTRPMAGASALFGLVLTAYQAYQASTLFGTNLNTVGVTSGVLFGVFAVICVYLEISTLSVGTQTPAPKKA